MKMNRKKTVAIASVAIASVMAIGMFAGCDLVLTNNTKNMNQTIAEVDITSSANFQKEFADFYEVKGRSAGVEIDEQKKAFLERVIGTASVTKREMIVSFVGAGYNAMTSYGWSYKDTFDAISDSLVQRQIYIQYAKAYFLKNGWTDEDGTEYTYDDLAKFNAAVQGQKGIDYEIAVLKYFLTEKEIEKADFATRVMFNNSIDSLEKEYIKEQEDEHDHEENVRTTPTGINTTNSDYYDPEYRVYTGTGKQSGVIGYETQKGSTATTRLRGYEDLIGSLRSNDLVKIGENTSDIESLEYFRIENRNDYEDALINKLTATFTKYAEAKIDQDYCEGKFNEILGTQRENFSASSSNLEKAMDSVSDTNFLLTATGNSKEESAFGYVINILLPFSTAQTDELNSVKQDFGDTKGNKFATRARLLKYVKATDQRGSWFAGEEDYSFKSDDGYTGTFNNAKDRTYLFFEDYLKEAEENETVKYERLKNYLGKYTYNGTWDEEAKKYKPYAINIDGFMAELEGYLDYALESKNSLETTTSTPANYYTRPASSYYDEEDGTVDYSKFVYLAGKVKLFSQPNSYDANNIFVKGSNENKVFSVINELSFAYNTDTAGLNPYLGYSVTANKTNFVSEFEYAAQWAVTNGAGSYIVVPSDYGWHIIYCTFSFVDSNYEVDGIKTPFQYDDEKKEEEGTFSYLFYESLKANAASTESSNRRSKIITSFKDSYTIYEKRYSDLSNLGR